MEAAPHGVYDADDIRPTQAARDALAAILAGNPPF